MVIGTCRELSQRRDFRVQSLVLTVMQKTKAPATFFSLAALLYQSAEAGYFGISSVCC
ncbi:hypothetical protein MtrunA17_Chr7g0253041 [Medicago truncatula]|uniref:Uncharacterized protein n=1 Tax=Medicago truncatula TaxID=3880 RepID=A0A396H262_MEDTR|nr:hypothetical protein MtrunA17_Chr7g0253041 [Medicago truncatula]